jgi:hypothetical protein|tara:strand:- start:4367 stop:4957 length:591 start_codon:yes stop_codon:yes gene_type:complete
MRRLYITNKYRLPMFTGNYMRRPSNRYAEPTYDYLNYDFSNLASNLSTPSTPYSTTPVKTDPVGKTAVLTEQQLTPTVTPGSNVTLQGTKGFTEGFTGGQSAFDPMTKHEMYRATHDLERGDEALAGMLGMLGGARKGGAGGAVLAWGTAMYGAKQKDLQQSEDLRSLEEEQKLLIGEDLSKRVRASRSELSKFIV